MTQIVLASTSDTDIILNLRADFYTIDNYPFDHQEQANNTHTFLQNPGLGQLWLVKSDDKTIGYICLTYGFSFEYGGKTAFIDELYITESYRGQGLGKIVMAFILEQAKNLKIITLHLEAEKHNPAANKLYQNFGFKDTKRNLLYCPVQ